MQAAFHSRSLSLYTSLGFDIREPLACVQGQTRERGVAGCAVRPAMAADLDACRALSLQVHGFDRSGELPEAIEHGTALVVERGGRITGYTNQLAFFGHTTAETNTDLQALIVSVEAFGGPGILVPPRNTALLRWCLGQRPARGPAHDADEQRTLQRACGSLAAIRALLADGTDEPALLRDYYVHHCRRARQLEGCPQDRRPHDPQG